MTNFHFSDSKSCLTIKALSSIFILYIFISCYNAPNFKVKITCFHFTYLLGIELLVWILLIDPLLTTTFSLWVFEKGLNREHKNKKGITWISMALRHNILLGLSSVRSDLNWEGNPKLEGFSIFISWFCLYE